MEEPPRPQGPERAGPNMINTMFSKLQLYQPPPPYRTQRADFSNGLLSSTLFLPEVTFSSSHSFPPAAF